MVCNKPASQRDRIGGRVLGASAVLAVAGLVAGLAGPAAAQGLRDLCRISDAVFDNHMDYHTISLRPSGEFMLADLKGPGMVTYFYITDSSGGEFYPGLVLKIFWGDEKKPSINVPLSDFFGAIGSKTIDYQSLPMQINHRCYMCYLPMPFSRRARFVLANDGDRDYSRSVAYGVDYEKSEEFADVKSWLHCAWRRSNPTESSMHTLLEVRGRGHYVGNFLQVFSNFKSWWGEGDTIFHVDGKKITHTPGTEDEYGSCWGFEHTYSYMYSGYLEGCAPGKTPHQGDNRMYRWYVANPVRFQKSLQVEIQNQRYDGGQIPSREDYTSVAFWYQDRAGPVALQPFPQRVAASRAAEYGEK